MYHTIAVTRVATVKTLNHGDLHVVLTFAKKIWPNTYIDVLGDPQLHSDAVIRKHDCVSFLLCVHFPFCIPWCGVVDISRVMSDYKKNCQMAIERAILKTKGWRQNKNFYHVITHGMSVSDRFIEVVSSCRPGQHFCHYWWSSGCGCCLYDHNFTDSHSGSDSSVEKSQWELLCKTRHDHTRVH